ncbi:hypothetical protein H1P_1550003 [Hyella patelloides LEGE 07179]|uniref:Uncharacterized protein n=1 Tax=Hyella patelloides LEGE 07179 TaxID=945734 RepID=A0A563VME3_9CYAN|nr:hypothetical protein H1P_1550003 [Hyella patelloides LEGE 07179]
MSFLHFALNYRQQILKCIFRMINMHYLQTKNYLYWSLPYTFDERQ